MIYEILTKNDEQIVKATDENGIVYSIPMDLGNSDYQQYLASLDEPDEL